MQINKIKSNFDFSLLIKNLLYLYFFYCSKWKINYKIIIQMAYQTKQRELLKEKITSALKALRSNKDASAINNFVEIFYDIYSEIDDIQETKASVNDIKLLIQEMRAGFQMMEKRFEGIDKRFENMIHYMDKRFEANDKRFEDLIHYMDKRFNALQWFMGVGFTIIAFLITFFSIFQI